MKKQIVGTMVTGLLLALMIAVPAHAQLPGTAMRANIPFDFIVRGKTLPAGTYEIKRISDSPGGLIIANLAERHEHAIFETEPVEVNKVLSRGEVVFHRYGDDYFLSEVLPAGEDTGSELMESRAERQLKRDLENNQTAASNTTEPETVTLVVVN